MAGAEAERARILGQGEAARIEALASAEASRAQKVGIAEARAVAEKVHAYGGPRFQLTQEVMKRFAEAIGQSGVEVVPRVLIQQGPSGDGGAQSGKGPGSGNLMEVLLTLLLSDRMAGTESATAPGASGKVVEVLASEPAPRA
jgi:uncharacterized membrane protein YqiK